MDQKKLWPQDVMIWCDWQSIYQDDTKEKLNGVKSLIRYAALCDYMLVPTEDVYYDRGEATDPERILGYGKRAWCRVEYFVFSLLAEMQGKEGEVQLYTIMLYEPGVEDDGVTPCPERNRYELQQYPKVLMSERTMPQSGALSNPDDNVLIRELEDQILDVYGHAIIEIKCMAAAKAKEGKEGPLVVDLSFKMLRPQHVDSLINACNKYKVAELYLQGNQLGRDGGLKLVSRGLWRQ